MLSELMLYATARACPGAWRLGLVGDAVALWSRATRCRHAWAPHQARCCAAVERSIAGLARRRTALVLGSGLQREIALPALLAAFERVVLVDAVHLWPARRAASAAGAQLAAIDLSGCAERSLGRAAGRADPLASWRGGEVDIVVSANLLSQMPMAFERRRERHADRSGSRSDERPDEIEGRLAALHLADLLSLDARVCLLTDVRHREVGPSGTVVGETDLLQGEILPPPDETWDWEVAPRGEAGPGRHVHRMHAYDDLGRSYLAAGIAEPSRAG